MKKKNVSKKKKKCLHDFRLYWKCHLCGADYEHYSPPRSVGGEYPSHRKEE